MTDKSCATGNTLNAEQLLAEVRRLAEIGLRSVSYNREVDLVDFELVSGGPLKNVELKVWALIGLSEFETPVENESELLEFIDSLS